MRLFILLGLAGAVVLALLAGRLLWRQHGSANGGNTVEHGKTAYFKHCVVCHSPDTDEYIAGASLKDYFRNPPKQLSDGKLFPRTDAAIRELIEKGTKNMPPLSQGMTPQEIDEILAYLHTL